MPAARMLTTPTIRATERIRSPGDGDAPSWKPGAKRQEIGENRVSGPGDLPNPSASEFVLTVHARSDGTYYAVKRDPLTDVGSVHRMHDSVDTVSPGG